VNSPNQCIGLVLSGGTLKGAAHVGVLAALSELNVPIHCVAGTSAGSLVATLWAYGFDVNEMENLVHAFPGVKLLDYGFPVSAHVWYHFKKRWYRKNGQKADYGLKVGLLNGKKLTQYVSGLLVNRRPLRPYYVVATDLNSGQPVIFSNDKDAVASGYAQAMIAPETAVQASCALPGIFRSVSWQGHLLADGSLRHYAPVDVLKAMGYQRMIVVNLLTLDTDWVPLTVVDVINRSFEILLRETIDEDLEDSEHLVVIEPSLAHVKWTSLSELQACYDEGKAAVFRKKRQIMTLLQEGTSSVPTVHIS